MRSRRTEFFRSSRVGRAVRWLLPAALLALTPKCLLCVVAYAGLGAALGLGGPEICGAPGGASDAGVWSLACLGLALGALGVTVVRRRRRGIAI